MKYASSLSHVDVIRTDTFLDRLSGIGGIPRGRITEIYGDPSVGKTSVCLQAIATAQKNGLKCLFADIEFSYETRYAESLGVNNKKLGLIQEQHAEAALDEIQKAVESGEWDLIVLDSIGGLLPRAESEKAAGEKVIGGQASLVAAFCRKIVPLLSLRNCALVVLNHSFTDIMSGAIKTSGGAKLGFHKSLSIRLRAKTGVVLKSGEKVIGKVVIAETKKNKLASTEGMVLEVQMIFGESFSAGADLMNEAIERLFERRGNTFYYEQEKLGMISAVRELFKQEDFAEKIKLALNG